MAEAEAVAPAVVVVRELALDLADPGRVLAYPGLEDHLADDHLFGLGDRRVDGPCPFLPLASRHYLLSCKIKLAGIPLLVGAEEAVDLRTVSLPA